MTEHVIKSDRLYSLNSFTVFHSIDDSDQNCEVNFY